MKSEDIVVHLSKIGDLIDLLFRKYWVYTYLIGFILFLNVILMIYLDSLWDWRLEGAVKKLLARFWDWCFDILNWLFLYSFSGVFVTLYSSTGSLTEPLTPHDRQSHELSLIPLRFFDTFGRGWLRRNDETKEQAHKLLVTWPPKMHVTCPKSSCH